MRGYCAHGLLFAISQSPAAEPMSLLFREYLARRRTKYSPTSNFLHTLLGDDEFAAVTSREELDAYLARRRIAPNGRVHAHAVWKSYLADRKRHAQAAAGERG